MTNEVESLLTIYYTFYDTLKKKERRKRKRRREKRGGRTGRRNCLDVQVTDTETPHITLPIQI